MNFIAIVCMCRWLCCHFYISQIILTQYDYKSFMLCKTRLVCIRCEREQQQQQQRPFLPSQCSQMKARDPCTSTRMPHRNCPLPPRFDWNLNFEWFANAPPRPSSHDYTCHYIVTSITSHITHHTTHNTQHPEWDKLSRQCMLSLC
jgi:hypothetical protein